MYKTIIFDLDGTLLDTLDDLTDAVNFALQKRGLKLRTREEVRAFIGDGIAKLIERALGEYIEYFDGALQDFKEYYIAHCADKTQPYAGIKPLLSALTARGVQTGVLSNKSDFAVKMLAKQYFDGLLLCAVGENEAAGIRKKPAPDSLLYILKSLNAEKETALYVGDSEVDIRTAKNAGVDCLCVTWGFRERAFLEENGGERFVDDPMEILQF